MESIKRSVMMLKSDNGTLKDLKHAAVLKLQSLNNGLFIDLTVPSQPADSCALYLFDSEGNDHFAGDIKDGRLNTELSGMPLDSVRGAAVADTRSMAFLLKSSGQNWQEITAHFKLKHVLPKTENKIPIEPLKIEEPPPLADKQPEQREQPAQPRVCDSCPHVIRQDKINPFPYAFPNSEWVKISYPGPTGWWHYISGKIYSGSTVVAKVLGVPGEYGMAPPIWLEGFGTYMRSAAADANGYWLMFQDAETGEVLDMGLSPRDG